MHARDLSRAPRPGVGSRARPSSHRSAAVLSVAAGLVAVLLAACASGDPGITVGPPPSGSASASASPAGPSADPASSAPPSVAPTVVPGDPSPSASAGPSPSTSAVPVAQCTGTEENRDFLTGVAEAVDWDVYCAVLPGGWYLESGTYRLSGGGWMEVSYRGPSGASLVLREGAFCQEAGDCVPGGTDVGSAAFGDREGTLVAADDGSWALTVDRGSAPAWLAVGSGIDEGTFRALTEELARVAP